jgi:hypothetical protein
MEHNLKIEGNKRPVVVTRNGDFLPGANLFPPVTLLNHQRFGNHLPKAFIMGVFNGFSGDEILKLTENEMVTGHGEPPASLQAVFYMKALIGFVGKVKSRRNLQTNSGSWEPFGKNFKTGKKTSSRPMAV